MKGVYLIIVILGISTTRVAAQYDNLVIEGAGIRGIAYCGALMELDERGVLKDVKRFAGASSGAINACLLAVGYTPAEMEKIISETNFAKFNDGGFFFIGGMHRLKKKLGWYKGRAFHKWLDELIYKKTGNADITFEELYSRAQIDTQYRELVVAVTCINHQETIYLSRMTFPKMRISDAVRSSMAIPYYFEPIVFNAAGDVVPFKQMTAEDHLCVDGGITANFPIRAFDAAPYCTGDSVCLGNTIGIRIDSDAQIKSDHSTRELVDFDIKTLGDFSGAFFYLMKESINRMPLTDDDWKRTISVSDSGIGPKVKKMSEAQKALLIKAGRDGVKRFYGEITD